jgi:release factor glutamine methyltransferase
MGGAAMRCLFFNAQRGGLDEHRTIIQALAWATDELRATSKTARLDAELLVGHVLGWERARILAEGRQPLTEPQTAALGKLVARRVALEPVAYLIGHKQFYGLDFAVDRRVLVPRPETELLVELAFALAGRMSNHERERVDEPHWSSSAAGRSSVIIADIGTGSGAIAVALALHLPQARIVATDISGDALVVARRNLEPYGMAERVQLVQGDLLRPLSEPVGMLVSNPPYTILAEIDEGVRRYEPHRALDGGLDGLDVYRRLLAQAPTKLLPGGAVLLEIGATQGAAVSELARQHFPAAQVSVHRDLAGLDRVITIDTMR